MSDEPIGIIALDFRSGGVRRGLVVSGDNEPAKAAVIELFDAAGLFPIDLGDLVTGGGGRPIRWAPVWPESRAVPSEWTMTEPASSRVHLWDADPLLSRVVGQ